MKGFIFGFLVLTCTCISGCVYDAGYNRYTDIDGTGYQEKSYGQGIWGVQFIGGYPDFCKEATFYRAAELTYQKGFRYFKVIDKKDRSGNVQTSGPRTTALGGHMGPTYVYVPMYYYKIQLLKQKASGPHMVDAYQVLNTHNYPREDKPYTVADRNKDKTAKKE